MPKGYLITRITVTDPDHYPVYAKLAGEVRRQAFGARRAIRGHGW